MACQRGLRIVYTLLLDPAQAISTKLSSAQSQPVAVPEILRLSTPFVVAIIVPACVLDHLISSGIHIVVLMNSFHFRMDPSALQHL